MVLPATRLALHRSATHQWMALACKVVNENLHSASEWQGSFSAFRVQRNASQHIMRKRLIKPCFPLPQLWWLPKYILRFGLVWLPSSVQVKFSYYKVKHVVKLLFKLAGTLFWDKYDERLTRLLASPVAPSDATTYSIFFNNGLTSYVEFNSSVFMKVFVSRSAR